MGEGSERIGGIVGGGFYIGLYREYFAELGAFVVKGCTSEGGRIVVSIALYLYGASRIVADRVAGAAVNEGIGQPAGATEKEVSLDQLR